MLLHFGAVDQSCTVWVNGREVGTHTGGYLPFSFDVTDLVGEAEDLLEVRVRDLSETGVHARGKQRLDRGTIWYTAQSGIWQTVWLEPVPATYVDRLVLVPHLDIGALEVTLGVGGVETVVPRSSTTVVRATITVSSEGRELGRAEAAPGEAVLIPLSEVHPWTPDDPHLYDVEVRLGEDRVTSFAGLRSFGVGRDEDGHPRLLLNGEPMVHVGVLDQGYWPDGLLTPPSDAAMVHDIETMKDLGFTMLRKHVKIEPLRWYAHCDRLGMLVWQDMVNGGGSYRHLLTRMPATQEGAGQRQMARTLPPQGRRRPRRVPPRGPRDRRSAAQRRVAGRLDPVQRGLGPVRRQRGRRRGGRARPHAAGEPRQWLGRPGWRRHPQLPQLPAPVPDAPSTGGVAVGRRVVALTEYGGHSMRVEGHDWSPREFGYRHVGGPAELEAGVRRAAPSRLRDAVREGLGALVYTQLSDVEDELNGLLTWDREVLKIDPEVVREVTAQPQPPASTQRCPMTRNRPVPAVSSSTISSATLRASGGIAKRSNASPV